MLTPYTEILQAIRDDWETLIDHPYPEDVLSEWADSEVPIYTTEIIAEWRDLDSDYWDRGNDYKTDDSTITDLMRYDLYAYYTESFYRAYREITDSLEEATE